MQQKYLLLASSVAILTSISASPAQAFGLFVDNRTDFNNSLTSNSTSTIIDTAGAFGADEAIATALPSLTRSGNINGSTFSYDVFDVNFSNSPTGNLSDDIFSTSDLNIEAPASQDGATGTGTWGIDSSGGNNSTRNAALFDFTVTPNRLYQSQNPDVGWVKASDTQREPSPSIGSRWISCFNPTYNHEIGDRFYGGDRNLPTYASATADSIQSTVTEAS